MNTKHTPGPWAVGFADGTGETYITAGDHPARNDMPVVVVSGAMDDWGVTHGVKNPHDARLIAAAPDLLAAMQSILYFIEEGGIGFEATCERVARAAIAKATGEQA